MNCLVPSLRLANPSDIVPTAALNFSESPTRSIALAISIPILPILSLMLLAMFTRALLMPPVARGILESSSVSFDTNSFPLSPSFRIPSASAVPNAFTIAALTLGMFSLRIIRSSFSTLPLPVICASCTVTRSRLVGSPPDTDTAFPNSCKVFRACSAEKPTPCNRSEPFTA